MLMLPYDGTQFDGVKLPGFDIIIPDDSDKTEVDRPTTSVNTPTEATSAAVLTPQAFNIKMIIAMAQAYFTKPSNNENIVFERAFFWIFLLKIILTILHIAYTKII